MAIEKVAKAGRRYLKFARRKLAQLDALRRDLGLQVMSKAYKVGKSLIWIKSSEWKDLIYITGDTPGVLVRAWFVGTQAAFARAANYLSAFGTGLRFTRKLGGKASWSRDYSTFAGTDSVSGEVHLRRTTDNSITGEQDTVVAGSVSANLSLWNMYVPDVASISSDGKRVIVATGASVNDGAFKHMEWNEVTKVFDEIPVTLPPEVASFLDGAIEYAPVLEGDDPIPAPYDSDHNAYERIAATWTPSFGPTAVGVVPLYTRIKIAPHGEPRAYVEVVTLETDPGTAAYDNCSTGGACLFVGEINSRPLYKVWEYRADTQDWVVWHEETYGSKTSLWYVRDHVFVNSLTPQAYPRTRFPRVEIVFDSDGNARRLLVEGGGHLPDTGPVTQPQVIERVADGVPSTWSSGSPVPPGWVLIYSGLAYVDTSGGFAPEINLQLDDVAFISDVADDGIEQQQFGFGENYMIIPPYMLPVTRNVGQGDRGAIVSRWTGQQASTGRKGLVWRWGTFGEEYVDVAAPSTSFSRSARWAKIGSDFYLDGVSVITIPGGSTVFWPSYSNDDRWSATISPALELYIIQLRKPLGEPEGAYGMLPPLNVAGDAELPADEYTIRRAASDPVYGVNVFSTLDSRVVPDDFIASPALVAPAVVVDDIVPKQTAPALVQLFRGHLPTTPLKYFPPDVNAPVSGVPADASGAWQCSGTSLRWYSRDLLMLYYGEYDIVVDGPALDPIVCVVAPPP